MKGLELFMTEKAEELQIWGPHHTNTGGRKKLMKIYLFEDPILTKIKGEIDNIVSQYNNMPWGAYCQYKNEIIKKLQDEELDKFIEPAIKYLAKVMNL